MLDVKVENVHNANSIQKESWYSSINIKVDFKLKTISRDREVLNNKKNQFFKILQF